MAETNDNWIEAKISKRDINTILAGLLLMHDITGFNRRMGYTYVKLFIQLETDMHDKGWCKDPACEMTKALEVFREVYKEEIDVDFASLTQKEKSNGLPQTPKVERPQA